MLTCHVKFTYKLHCHVDGFQRWYKETGYHVTLNCNFKYGPPVCLLAGVPNEVVQRADSVLEDIHSKKPTRRVTSEKLTATDKQHQVHDLAHNDI